MSIHSLYLHGFEGQRYRHQDALELPFSKPAGTILSDPVKISFGQAAGDSRSLGDSKLFDYVTYSYGFVSPEIEIAFNRTSNSFRPSHPPSLEEDISTLPWHL
jgi:hypothetical protein